MSFKRKFLFIAALTSVPLFGHFEAPYEKLPESIEINNRILLKIDGKPITIMDVVKKMDLLFYRQYPELASNPVARYQFYSASWRTVLTSVVDDQLIMADASEKKVEISDGEVREELETLFGPDVVLNLDKLGMTLAEAFDLLKTELIVQRMMGVMVRSKALMEVHPQVVRERFEKWSKNNPSQNYWVYRVLTIRGPNHKEVAQKAVTLLNEQNIALDMIPNALNEEGVEIVVSEEYVRSDREISRVHKAILQTLEIGKNSLPESQKDASKIFCLKNKEMRQPATFKEMEDKLRKEIMDETMMRLNLAYREKLRTHYGLTEKVFKNEIPENLEPFALR